jgi:hypothetical protein
LVNLTFDELRSGPNPLPRRERVGAMLRGTDSFRIQVVPVHSVAVPVPGT